MANRPFQISGSEVPTPSTLKVEIEDLSSEATGRLLTGEMVKDVVAVKATVAVTWKSLTWAEAALILYLVDGKESLSVRYPDPRQNGVWKVGTFYVGKRSITARDLSSKVQEWSDCSFSFIEI